MIRLSPLPEVVYRRRLLVSGSCAATDAAPLVTAQSSSSAAQSVQSLKVGASSWNAWLVLNAGTYTISVEGDSAQVQVVAATPVKENLRTSLDEMGALDSLPRDPGEALPSYQQRLRDAWLRPGGRNLQGTMRNLERVLRLSHRLSLVVLSTDPTATIQVYPDRLRWTCGSYLATETVRFDPDRGGVTSAHPVLRVLRLTTEAGAAVTVGTDLKCADPGDGPLELVYQYWRVLELSDPSVTLEQLLGQLNSRCARSGYDAAARKGNCAKGHGQTWPARFVETTEPTYLGCANATCPDYRSDAPVRFAIASDWSRAGFVTSEDLLALPALQLCGDGVPLTLTQVDRQLWMATIETSEVGVRPLSSPITRRALSGSVYINSPLRRIQDEMEQSFLNLWDRGSLGRVVVSPASAACYDPIVPAAAPDQVAPELFASGVAVAAPSVRLVAQDSGAWQARVKPGFFWHGAQQFYLYADKRAVSLASCAVLELPVAGTLWADGQEPGQIGIEDGEPVFISAVETPLAAQVSLARGSDRLVIPAPLVQLSPGLVRIALGPLLAQYPGLWEALRLGDTLLFTLLRSGDFTATNLAVPLRSATLRWRLPSNPVGNAPVVVTNNAARRSDAYATIAERYASEEFFVEDGWISFSRRPSLISNGGFEHGSEDWRFLSAAGADATADAITLTSPTSLPGSVWRGDSAVMFKMARSAGCSIQTEATLSQGLHTISFAARKGQLSGGLVDTDSSIPLRLVLTPLDASGAPLAWPGLDFDGKSDPYALTNNWTRYALSFGSGARRLPAGTAKLRLQLVSLGGPVGSCVALVDAVQLEEGTMTDYAERDYGYGDDLTVEYETSDGEYVPQMDVNPAVLDSSVLGLAETEATALIKGQTIVLDDWNPYYDAALRPQTLDKSLHRGAAPYAQVSGSNKLRWRRRFGVSDSSQPVTDLPSQLADEVRQLTLVAPQNLTRGESAQLAVLLSSASGAHAPGTKVQFSLEGPGLIDPEAITDGRGHATVRLQVPEISPVLRLTAAQVPLSTLQDQSGNPLSLDLVGDLDSPGLAVAMDGADIYTGSDLSVLQNGTVSWRPFRLLSDFVNRAQTLNSFATLVSSVVRQDDRLSRFTIQGEILPGSARLTINGEGVDVERSLSACYATPGTCFIDYGAGTTWFYYHTATITSFALSYIPRCVHLSGNSLLVDIATLGLPLNCWLRLAPQFTVRVTARVAGASDPAATASALVTTEPPLLVSSSGLLAVRDLAIIFDQQTGSDLYPPKPGSGDSLRVQLKWRHPAPAGAASYLFRWSAKGPTGFYNEGESCVAQIGDQTQPFLFFDRGGHWLTASAAIPVQNTPSVDVIVKWPGSALDDTQDSGVMRDDRENLVVYSRFSEQAGGDVIWEGGGIDNALYTAEVLTLDAAGRVMGSAVAAAQAPDLTPPLPPQVYPAGNAITLTLDARHADLTQGLTVRADDPSLGAAYAAIAASGVIRVSYISGSVAGIEPTSGFQLSCKGKAQDLSCSAPSAGLAELASVGQYAMVVFDADEAASPPPLTLALPCRGEGSVVVQISSAAPWISQPAGDPAVTVRWSEKTYLRRDLDTGLFSASYDKEVKL